MRLKHRDINYPFILMNLVLSIQAAYGTPIIMMSQNRHVEHDHLDAHNDYLVNKKAEEEVRAILEHSPAQNDALIVIYIKNAVNRCRLGGCHGLNTGRSKKYSIVFLSLWMDKMDGDTLSLRYSNGYPDPESLIIAEKR